MQSDNTNRCRFFLFILHKDSFHKQNKSGKNFANHRRKNKTKDLQKKIHTTTDYGDQLNSEVHLNNEHKQQNKIRSKI